MECVSPYNATWQSFSTYVTGCDDTYEGEEEERKKNTLVKHLIVDNYSSLKDILKFMIGVNSSENHWQAVLIDAENNKIYSHCSLRHAASNVDKVVKGFQIADVLKIKKDMSDLYVDKYRTVKALYQHNGWSCGDHIIGAAFKFFFGELLDMSKEWNLCDLYPFHAMTKIGMDMFYKILRYYTKLIVTHTNEEVAAFILSKQKTIYFEKHTRTMKAEYNFIIRVYRTSDPDKWIGQINSNPKDTEYHWKYGGN
eukprot:6488654-Ditylum_brightwellii.AAC.1